MMCLDIIELTRRELLKVGIFLGVIRPPKRRPKTSVLPPFIWGG